MRVGVLGGTFDPIHNGHIEMATRVQRFFACDLFYLMPAYSPPHKAIEKISSSYHRYAMAAIATLALDGVEVSRLELEAPARPYTVQTMVHLNEAFGNQAQLFFVMGADSFRELETWRDFSKLLASCSIVVVTRPGYQLDLAERSERLGAAIVDLRGQREPVEIVSAGPSVYVTDLIELDISATAVRTAVAADRPITELVPAEVAQYIAKYRLYQDQNETDN